MFSASRGQSAGFFDLNSSKPPANYDEVLKLLDPENKLEIARRVGAKRALTMLEKIPLTKDISDCIRDLLPQTEDFSDANLDPITRILCDPIIWACFLLEDIKPERPKFFLKLIGAELDKDGKMVTETNTRRQAIFQIHILLRLISASRTAAFLRGEEESPEISFSVLYISFLEKHGLKVDSPASAESPQQEKEVAIFRNLFPEDFCTRMKTLDLNTQLNPRSEEDREFLNTLFSSDSQHSQNKKLSIRDLCTIFGPDNVRCAIESSLQRAAERANRDALEAWEIEKQEVSTAKYNEVKADLLGYLMREDKPGSGHLFCPAGTTRDHALTVLQKITEKPSDLDRPAQQLLQALLLGPNDNRKERCSNLFLLHPEFHGVFLEEFAKYCACWSANQFDLNPRKPRPLQPPPPPTAPPPVGRGPAPMSM